MAGDASRENGTKGGRPKGFAALEAERTRVFIAERIAESNGPIIAKAITQAMEGDSKAREWLYERAFGKPPQPLTGEDGEGPIAIEISEAIAGKYGLVGLALKQPPVPTGAPPLASA